MSALTQGRLVLKSGRTVVEVVEPIECDERKRGRRGECSSDFLRRISCSIGIVVDNSAELVGMESQTDLTAVLSDNHCHGILI